MAIIFYAMKISINVVAKWMDALAKLANFLKQI